MSGLAHVTDVQHQGLVFLNSDHISSVHEISEGTEITLTLLSIAAVGATLATIVGGLANLCAPLRKKLVSGS
ncbi:MAG: hypothetical protein DMG76_34460 [Acidobacteria bacterium]|nr:MAG: hypothetical protein DMG76_34460 [Acidobacteriota bacterium]